MQLLTTEIICQRTLQSRASLYNKLNPKSKYYDPSFPKPRRLGMRCVRWVEDEIHTWMNNPGANVEGGV